MQREARLAQEAGSEFESHWAAIASIAANIGRKAETSRRWVRQSEGTTTAKSARLKSLEREVKELRKANEILRLAGAFFA
jgi:transposase-like protein